MAGPKKGRGRKNPRKPKAEEPPQEPSPESTQPSDAAAFLAALGFGKPPAEEPAKPKGKGGRPPIPIDTARVFELLKLHCTDEEIAADQGCSVRTIERRRAEDEDFRLLCESALIGGRVSLKRELWGLALRANQADPPRGAVSALIFLCKQPISRGGLGMTDRLSSEGGGKGGDLADEEQMRDELIARLERIAPESPRSRRGGGGKRSQVA